MKGWSAMAAGVGRTAGHKNMLQLIHLRWIAVIGQITTIAVVSAGMGIRLPLQQMLLVLACLVVFNFASQWWWNKGRAVTNLHLFFALLVDVASLTAQLYFSGGTTNPFASLYLLQVIISAVLLAAWSTWTIVAITTACLLSLADIAKPLRELLGPEQDVAELYVMGLVTCFVINAALLVVFITRISSNLRAGDAQLARMRQRAAEEEHIVRMGLLASGAAHELGTPLATLSVILGDWRRMPAFRDNSELQEEIVEMQAQLQRCKSIVSGILLSAGEARGESSVRTTIRTFLNDLVTEWRASRPVATFVYENHMPHDLPVVFDSTLKQTIVNMLDNALEASPKWLGLEARLKDDTLQLEVTDAGPGFAPAMLADFGKPYQSSKGRPGSGLGLFLAVNVARTLGGTISARNGADGGAAVELHIPLSAIALEEEAKDAG
nr:ATP-binding protein [Noviherbaspirillum sedimenti]